MRCGLPCASRPVVDSSTSIVRLPEAILLARPLAGAKALPHVLGQILERVGDGQLFHRVAGLGILREGLSKLLSAAETATQREILAERKAFLVLLPHQDAAKIRMSDEADAEHVEALPLEPVSSFPDRPDAGDLERASARERRLDPEESPIRERAKMPDDLDRGAEVTVLDSSDVAEEVVSLAGIIVKPLHHIGDARGLHIHCRLAPHDFASLDGSSETLGESGSRWIRCTAPVLNVFR